MDFDNSLEIITPTKSTSLTIGGTGALFIPAGTTGQRPSSPQSGYVRFNTSNTVLEYYDGVAIQWQTFGSSNLNALSNVSGTGTLVQTSPGVYAARTITGTTNRITVTNGDGVAGNPTLDISSAYVGQATITTLGTVGTGVWQGTAVGATFGGTGQTSYAVGDILYANTTTTLAKLSDIATGNALISGGVNTAPSWGKIGLATHVSGTLPIANGGTGLTTTPANGQLLIGNGTGYALSTVTGTAGNVTVTNGAGSITLNLATAGTAGTYATVTTDAFGRVTSGVTTQTVATGGTGLTSLGTANQVLGVNAGATALEYKTVTAGTGISVTNGAGSITLANTGVTSIIAGSGISVSGATGAVTITSTSSGGTVTSVSASGGTTGLTFTGSPITTSGTLTLGGTLGIANGGTGLTTTPTNGQLLIGNGTNYNLSTLTAGTGISVTNGSGTITLNNTGVTSVALALPPIFTVSGSPVTTTGTLTGTLNTQAANTVFAGPTTGTAVPTFRTLSLDELNDVTSAGATTGQYLLYNGTAWVPYGGAGTGGGLRTWGGNVASQTGTSVIAPGTTPPTIAQGTEIASLTLTPLSTSSKFTVQMSISVSASTNNNVHTCAIFRGSTYIGGAIQTFASGGNSNAISITLTDAPATVSPVTYSARYGTSANTWYINRRTSENTYGGVNSGFEIQEY